MVRFERSLPATAAGIRWNVPVLSEFVKRNAVGWHTFLDMVETELKGRASRAKPTRRRTPSGTG